MERVAGWRAAVSLVQPAARSVQVRVFVPAGTAKRDVKVDVSAAKLKVALKGAPLAELRLYAAVSADDSTWTLGADSAGAHVCISMEKLHAETWPQPEAVG